MIYNIKKFIGGGVQNLVSNLVLVSLQNKFYAGGGCFLAITLIKKVGVLLDREHRDDY